MTSFGDDIKMTSRKRFIFKPPSP